MTDQQAEQIVKLLQMILAEIKAINEKFSEMAKLPPAAAASFAPRE